MAANGVPEPWSTNSTFGVVVGFLIAITLAGILIPTSMRLVIWLVILVLLALFVLVVGRGITGQWLGFLIDERNKMSLSRFQIGLWGLLIFSAYLAAALTNLHIVMFSAPVDALSITIPPELLGILGISATSLVGAPVILSDKSKKQQLDVNTSRDQAAWYDIFQGDDTANNKYLDLSKVQMFYATIILILVYGVALGTMFMGAAQGTDIKSLAITAFPALNVTAVTLLGISHAGYLVYKGVPRNADQGTASAKADTNNSANAPDPSVQQVVTQ